MVDAEAPFLVRFDVGVQLELARQLSENLNRFIIIIKFYHFSLEMHANGRLKILKPTVSIQIEIKPVG